MRLNREISMGNLVSWGLILMAFVAGYSRLQGNVETATARAEKAELVAVAATAQVHAIEITLAEIRVTAKNIERNVDEIKLAIKR